MVPVARDFMANLPLGRFGTSDRRIYGRQLDAATHRLMKALPRRGSSWGISRKLLNIFLRDCLYTGYLSKAYGLGAAEHHMEVPLDSITAKGIRAEVPELPRWKGVKHLDPATSAHYQTAALMLGRERGLARVHLDAYLWGGREEAGPAGHPER
jgi:hypothetical protein